MCHFSRPVPAQSSVRGIRKLVVSKCGLSVVRIFEIASSANQGRLWLVCRAQRDRVGTVDADETQLADRLGDGVGVNLARRPEGSLPDCWSTAAAAPGCRSITSPRAFSHESFKDGQRSMRFVAWWVCRASRKASTDRRWRSITIKQGKTRIESKCAKCGALNRVSAAQGQVWVPWLRDRRQAPRQASTHRLGEDAQAWWRHDDWSSPDRRAWSESMTAPLHRSDGRCR